MSKEKPAKGREDCRNGYDRKTSLAVGNVLRSGILQRLFKPQMLESTTRRGGRESDLAIPSLPTETPLGNSC